MALSPEPAIRCIYTPVLPADGLRILVDGLWPRGLG